MAERKSYSELLRDPRWQKKRLEILGAANFTCQSCGASDKTLNVHHTWYKRGAAPWEYENFELLCFCEECHKSQTSVLDRLHRAIGLCQFLTSGSAEEVLGYAEGMIMSSLPDSEIEIVSYEHAQGIARFFGVRTNYIVTAAMANDGKVSANKLTECTEDKREKVK